jgi:hypothetical protein
MTAAPGPAHTTLAAGEMGECPHCGRANGTPLLLTSMTRYYVCGSCTTRWSVARQWLDVRRPEPPVPTARSMPNSQPSTAIQVRRV